jgi:hypothetical protein
VRGDYRYVAVRMTGDGAGEVVHTEVPLAEVQLTGVLSGPPGIAATVLPVDANMQGEDRQPLFGHDQEWGLAIFAEVDGTLLDEGGIMTSCVEQTNGSYSITCEGFGSYPTGMPYTSEIEFVQTDALDIFRHVWTHLQGEPGGDLGLTVDSTMSGVLLGQAVVEDYDETTSTASDAGPYALNWWSTGDLGKVINDLATDTPFDWYETHAWNGNQIAHNIQLGVPQLGYRRTDGDLVVGENVPIRPSYASAGPDYASDVLVLGAGEGRAMVTGHNGHRTGKLRRIAMVSDKSLQDSPAAFTRAARELGLRTTLPTISSVTVSDSASAPLLSYRVGDEVPFIDPLNDLLVYVRILSRTLDPSKADQAVLTVARTDVGIL